MNLFRRISRVFLPHPENGHHPHILRKEAILTSLSFLVFVEAFFLANAAFLPHAGPYAASVLPATLASLSNDARTDDGLSALSWNTKLADAAATKAKDMAAKGYFAHVSPDGTQPWKWIQGAGYQYQYAGENLAVDFTDSEDVVRAWLNSPTHRANLLGTNYTEIGIGVADGVYEGKTAIFVVQYFGKPAPGASVKTVVVAPTKTVPAPAARVVAVATSSQVLGAESVNPVTAAVASPRATVSAAYIAIAAFFALLLALALIFRKRLPRGAASIGAVSVVAAALGLVIFNQYSFPEAVRLPADTQPAAVFTASAF